MPSVSGRYKSQTPPMPQTQLEQLGYAAAGLAHEIKNPLSTMNLTLQILHEEWAQAETKREKKTKRKIEILQKEIKRLERILDEFLSFARAPALSRMPHDLNRLVNECLDLLQPELEASRVSVRTFLADDLPSVPVDRDQLKQAILNILINARQAMDPVPIDDRMFAEQEEDGGESAGIAAPRGGEIFITTRLAPSVEPPVAEEVTPTPLAVDTSAVEIEITDTGPGIPKDIVDSIFNPYVSTKSQGTGMGLAIARRIITDHNGTVTVVSEPGKGTQFRLRLPRES